MAVYEIPLSPMPQTFGITLGGVQYKMTVQYRNINEGGWMLDIADAAGNPMVQGIPMVTGTDLLAQYKHLGINGQLRVQTTSNPDAVPIFGNLGTDSHLYWVAS